MKKVISALALTALFANAHFLTPEFLNIFIIESRIPNSWYLQRL